MMAESAGRKALSQSLRAWRRVAGGNTPLERRLKRRLADRRETAVKRKIDDDFVEYTGLKFVYLESKSRPGGRVGVFMKGSCDLPSVFAAVPLIRERLRGSMCIFHQGTGITDARPDVLLQSRLGIEEDRLRAVVDRVDLLNQIGVDYFRPRLFEPTFSVPGLPQQGVFAKNVVILSISPALVRTAYRHREQGFIIDPGGFWLNQSMDSVLQDLSLATWFKDNFKSVGKMTVDDFHDSFGEVIRLVQKETGASVVVLNSLVVDPGSPIHSYQFTRNAPTIRRRMFDLALRDLSRTLDFHIVDIDRILKGLGVQEQVDFAHFPIERAGPIGAEIFRIFRDLEVV